MTRSKHVVTIAKPLNVEGRRFEGRERKSEWARELISALWEEKIPYKFGKLDKF